MVEVYHNWENLGNKPEKKNEDTCTRDCGPAPKRAQVEACSPGKQRLKIKKVIAVISGKGGVGKSMVTSMLAVLAMRRGGSAILDADITGPSYLRFSE